MKIPRPLLTALALFATPLLTNAATTINLSSSWKFATDPTNIGASTTYHWFSDTFDDSAWQTLLSGSPWESQGINYAGYAWYRQSITVPAAAQGAPMTLSLASIYSDDQVYFNGVLIAGFAGEYKYNNIQPRVYTIPASSIRYGQPNTLAIRLWGGNLGFQGKKSGLVAGTYKGVLDLYHIMARNPLGSISSEKPLELWDLSSAQQGHAFELVYRFDPAVVPTGAQAVYTLKDFYGASILTGTTTVTTGTDNIARAVASISAPVSQTIYYAGRFKASVKVTQSGSTLFDNTATPLSLDNLTFSLRDETILTALSGTTIEATPYGNLKLIDTIDCSTPTTFEVHPYLQSAFGTHAQDYMTPGVKLTVNVNTILGKGARETATWGWFAYRIGRGKLTPGKSYLLRIEYPEDKARFCPVEVQVGQNYMDVGWKNGISSTDVYDNWPLSGAWQFYDIVVPLGDETTGAGGAGDGNAQKGFWVYFMDKRKPGYYFSPYAGGPAVASMRLYEISSGSNAPTVTLPPAGLPQRVMTFDWERQPTAVPADLVEYAKLMGYSAISPVILKWDFANYGDPVAGFDSTNVDKANYWVTSKYVVGSGTAPAPAIAGVKSVHFNYLAATKNSGINYIPRFEYGGSYDLPTSARAIASNGAAAVPDRFGSWCSDLLNAATYTDMKKFLDSFIKPYTATNPQLTGALWRVREDRMPISYSSADIDIYCADTGTTKPTGYTAAQLAAWASTGTNGAAYATWWHGKRADFHHQLVTLMKSYRSDLTLYYYNWDADKFSMMLPDLNSADFYAKVASQGGPTAYANDRAARAGYTDTDYINAMTTGDFTAALGYNRPDYALHPSLYSSKPGIQLFAPANYLCYANLPNYLNYFQTADGLAVSNCVSYDEIASREPNPKYEGNMILPGGGPFSMAMELLAYYHGDARTLTYTVYTYGRGFADAHRRFAQAFRALPAVPGTVVSGTPTNTKVRTYSTSNGTYVGIAYKGYAAGTFNIDVPGTWTAANTVTNLVTNTTIPTVIVSGKIRIPITAGPMELDSFLIQ